MITKQTFLNNLRKIQQDAPSYRTGGTGADGTCDCIGLIMGAMYAAGQPNYDMHSTNYFSRYQMDNFYPVSSEAHVYAGMVVYKARDDQSQLNARYKTGGRYYTGDMLDYYHVGVVMSTNPLQIMHCTSGNGANGIIVDDAIGRWNYGGMLKGIQYEATPQEENTEMYEAKVTAPSGSTVNMRMRPDESAAVVVRVPIGSTVDVQTQADGWARIVWNGTVGYMMDKFLSRVADDAEAGANEEFVTISLPLPVARIVMQALQEVTS